MKGKVCKNKSKTEEFCQISCYVEDVEGAQDIGSKILITISLTIAALLHEEIAKIFY